MAQAFSELDPQKGRETESPIVILPDPINLPIGPGVEQGISLGTKSKSVPAFSYAVFDTNLEAKDSLRAAFDKVTGGGHTLRGAMVDGKVAVSTGVKHPLYLANHLRGRELDLAGEGDGLAFEVREVNPGDPLEIRFSAGERREGQRKKHHKKRHEKNMDELKDFFRRNLPKNYWRKGKPIHVIV